MAIRINSQTVGNLDKEATCLMWPAIDGPNTNY